MPRYTDIDLLIDKVEGTDWYHISKQGELVRGANSKDDIPLYKHSDIKEVLNNAPVADVVPKSELSIVGVQNMALVNTKEDLQRRLVAVESVASAAIEKASDMVIEAKREVAMEIFADIERLITKECLVFKDENGIRGYVDASVHYAIAELKKKYTNN